MAERLTGKDALTVAPADTDVFHVVDVSDTSEHATGSSKKLAAKTLMAKGLATIQGCIVLARPGGGTSPTTLAGGDLVVYLDATQLIVAWLITTVSTIPDDLRNKSKAYKFIDTEPAL